MDRLYKKSAVVVKKDVADPDPKQKVTQSETLCDVGLFFLADSKQKGWSITEEMFLWNDSGTTAHRHVLRRFPA